VREFAARLLDQLRRGGVVVGFPVRVVVVLIRIEIAIGVGCIEAARLTNGAVSALERTCQPQLGAKRPKDELSLGTRVFRQAQRHFVPTRRAHHRVGDAGVSRRRIQNRAVRSQTTGGLALQNHARGRPVFHRSTRVLPLGLRVQLHSRRLALELAQPDQWRASDHVEDRRTGCAIKNGRV
jgi:hypothetical protein